MIPSLLDFMDAQASNTIFSIPLSHWKRPSATIKPYLGKTRKEINVFFVEEYSKDAFLNPAY